ncbi:CalY family protein [Clostridium sp. SHJSY1]|uniref:TasA family protein n=1 Tax=Clostridium sp. SHJSY1 TaxID=2942483 RepID=UPI002876D17F|nr:TasA family protein [Clostridium sp. SHJSY1]MDS0527439.1 CalY family protein [Clostridium sp. SHJSY1]
MLNVKKKVAMLLATTALGSMLVGVGTFSLFTDSATNTGNTFTSGKLDINLDKADGTKYFDVTNMAPGDSGQANVTVFNDGTLDLRYDIAETLTGGLAEGTTPLQITIKDSEGNVITPGDNNRLLAAGGSEVLTVEYKLPLQADNFYQGKEATLGLTVNAEQTKNN